MKTSHPMQSQAWGSFRQAMGIDVVQTGSWQLTFHKIPYTPFTIGYFPKGPMPNKAMLDKLTILAKQKNTIFIQLEPNVIGNDKLIIENFDLRYSHRPLFTRYTFILDLTKSEEELLRAMHPKTRYNIRVAQKHEVIIKEDNSPQAFQTYLTLARETTQRQGFYAHNETYHKTMWKIMNTAGIAHL
ncbi:peptidoglycan bridge formation glycyltransferase FemA/FemB family protein, partial [Candidatus Gottesmanbacteria bacterium]|nr:peptidoglycan bridge formation glycyltransferase FemA/FemB family protein [Candidatus Gottesmanbacteria bacterium]